MNDQELERLYLHTAKREDEQSVLTQRLISDVLFDRAITAVGISAAAETVDLDAVPEILVAVGFEPVFFPGGEERDAD